MLPAAVMAECADGTGLASGMRFVDVEGTVTVHRALDAETVEISVDYGDGTGVVEVRRFGLHPLTTREIADGTPVDGFEFTYDGGVDALPRPMEITEVEIASAMVMETGSTDWVLTYIASETGQTMVGDCAYATREIRVHQQGPLAPPQWERYIYFVDLGTAHLAEAGMGRLRFNTSIVTLEALGE